MQTKNRIVFLWHFKVPQNLPFFHQISHDVNCKKNDLRREAKKKLIYGVYITLCTCLHVQISVSQLMRFVKFKSLRNPWAMLCFYRNASRFTLFHNLPTHTNARTAHTHVEAHACPYLWWTTSKVKRVSSKYTRTRTHPSPTIIDPTLNSRNVSSS